MTKRGNGIVEDFSGSKKQRTMNNGTHSEHEKEGEIDEDLHSRQLAVYGRESMRLLMQANVLIVGATGLGAEIAKNAILAGVKSVTLHDKGEVTLRDLSAQFYLTEEDIGKNRAEACRERLQELNIAVAVSASSEELTFDVLGQFQVVAVTNSSLAEGMRINEACRKQKVPFIRADTRGVFASLFCDFGPSFTVFDTDGEEPHSGIVAGVTAGYPTIVTTVEDEMLEFEEGELVTFSEVSGMEDLNGGRFRIKSVKARAHMFELDVDSSSWAPYVRGGIVSQVKEGKDLPFKSLREALEDPGEFLLSDFSKMERPGLLHLGFQALDAFTVETGRFPGAYNEADATRLLEIATSLLKEAKKGEGEDSTLDEAAQKVLKTLAYVSGSELNPMAAFLGGVVGQEVVKAVSGKFTPLRQWFYFDSVESLPDELPKAEDIAPRDSRYDPQIAVFGRDIQERLEKLKLFLVGAGALGCELLKNFALMGIATAAPGTLTVTDDDVIEKSNLSRQFLFRDWNIGSSKSTVAAAAANAINPAVNIVALQNRVSPETENVFDDSFWESQDLVVNALDNITARMYVDSRCVYFGKPLLESGTLGPKCNTQMIIPNLTENYGASRDPPEKQAPMCTLHSFPHNIDHCLTFARNEFEGLLEKAPAEANAFLTDPVKYIASVRASSDAAAREQMEKVVEVLVTDRCTTFEDCIRWARLKFQTNFYDRIAQLTYTFPEDAVTSTGALFWSAPKRFPRPVVFSPEDPSHASFMQAAAILRAEVFGIPRPDWAADAQKVVDAAAKVVVPKFVPKRGVTIETDPNAKNPPVRAADDDSIIEDLIKNLRGRYKLGFASHLSSLRRMMTATTTWTSLRAGPTCAPATTPSRRWTSSRRS
eukprot:jgi/Botrbrau1/1972/Bobra.0052s0015.1